MLGIKGIFTNQLDSIKFNVPHCTYVAQLHGKTYRLSNYYILHVVT